MALTRQMVYDGGMKTAAPENASVNAVETAAAAAQASPIPRLYLGDDCPFAVGETITPSVAQSHYLTRVMRRGVGESVLVFNGRDGEMLAEVTAITKKHVTLILRDRTRAQTLPPTLGLAFAPVKKTATDFIVEKATELGVGILQPVMTEYTQVKAARVNTARLTANAIEAAEQTGRLTIPEIRAPISLTQMLEDWPQGRHIVFCDETRAGKGGEGMADGIKNPGGGGGEATILIGPVGGFAPGERAMLYGMPFVTPIALGENILRSETAAIAALAIWQSRTGAWA